VRPPVDHIAAPPFPARLPWFNTAALRMDQQLGRPVLIEFWDFCRPNSIRTLPSVTAWHERYADAGLRVIGVHASGFEPSASPEAVGDAVARLGIPYPVVVDTELEIWQFYGNLGWPGRYLFNQDGMLAEFHYGEGGYADTELVIQELLTIDGLPPVLAPIRPEDEPGAILAPQSEDRLEPPFDGPYSAGGVWAVLDGHGSVTANGSSVTVEHPGAYPLIEHERAMDGELQLEVGDGVSCYGVCFTPGLSRAG
jgi:thiol-disulfide isomerase/thioredoxin